MAGTHASIKSNEIRKLLKELPSVHSAEQSTHLCARTLNLTPNSIHTHTHAIPLWLLYDDDSIPIVRRWIYFWLWKWFVQRMNSHHKLTCGFSLDILVDGDSNEIAAQNSIYSKWMGQNVAWMRKVNTEKTISIFCSFDFGSPIKIETCIRE